MSKTLSDATPNVFQFKNGEKMKHPNKQAFASLGIQVVPDKERRRADRQFYRPWWSCGQGRGAEAWWHDPTRQQWLGRGPRCGPGPLFDSQPFPT